MIKLSKKVVGGILSEVRVHSPEDAHSLAMHLDALDEEISAKDAEIAALKADVEKLDRLRDWLTEQEQFARALPLGHSQHGGPFHGAPTFDLTMRTIRLVRDVLYSLTK